MNNLSFQSLQHHILSHKHLHKIYQDFDLALSPANL